MRDQTGPKPDPGVTPAAWHIKHLWQIQPVRDLLVLASIGGIVYVGYILSVVTVPILLAMLLAYLFEPLVQALLRIKWLSRQGVALGIIFAAGVVIVAPVTIGAAFGIVQGAGYAASLAKNCGNLVASVQQSGETGAAAFEALPEGTWRNLSEDLRDVRAQVRERREGAAPGEAAPRHRFELSEDALAAIDAALSWVGDNSAAIAQSVGKRAIGTGAEAVGVVTRTVGSIGMVVFTGLLTAFFFYFFCTGYGRVLAFWRQLIPERRRGRVFELLSQMDRVIAGFVRGRLLICAILSVYMTIAYWLIGVPAPLLLGPIVGALFMVPFVHIVGVPIAIALMWLEPGGPGWQNSVWWTLAAPVVVYVVGQALDDYVLTPMIQGKSTGMDTPSILFASLAGGVLAGIYGVLIAIPVAACVKILVRELLFPRIRAWAAGREKDPLPVSES